MQTTFKFARLVAALILSLVIGLAVSPAMAEPAKRLAGVISRDVAIPAGDITLAATLHLPPGASKNMPAIVIVHGSGPTTRDMTGFWTNTVLQAGGVAVLVYDKRGTGKSTGSYPNWDLPTTAKMFSDFASDAEHAVRWLAAQPGIDRTKLGMIGGSQAGWIMPIAASREPLIRYLFIGEGVPLAAGVEDVHSGYLNSVAKYREIRPTLSQVAGADILAEDYIGERGFDPADILGKLEIPTMWTFGLYDEAIPTRLSIDRIGQLQKAGRRNFDIHIFPFGDHNFYDVFSGKRYPLASVIREWLDRNGITRPTHLPPPPHSADGRSPR